MLVLFMEDIGVVLFHQGEVVVKLSPELVVADGGFAGGVVAVLVAVFLVNGSPIIISRHFTTKIINYNDYMLGNHSPQKENRSPSPRKTATLKHPSKTSYIVHELTALLRSNSISIPQHLSVETDENGPIHTKRSDPQDAQLLAKTKAKLADKEFEVKRLEEDFAEYKLLSKLEYEKVNKKLRDQISALKDKYNEQNKKWGIKFAQTQKAHEQLCSKFKEETQEHYDRLRLQEVNGLKKKHSVQVEQLNEAIEGWKKYYGQAINTLRKDYEQQICTIKMTHQLELDNLSVQHQEEVKKTEESYEAKVLAIECEKQAEVKEAEVAKQSTAKKEETYLKQIGKLQIEKRNIIERCDDTEMRYKVMQKRFQDQVQETERLKKKHKEELAARTKELEMVKSKTEQTIESEKLKIMKEHYRKTQTLENKFKELQTLKDNMAVEFQKNQKIMDKRFERRESRKEDVQFIKEIEHRLAEKEKEATQLYNHLKYFQMEKENNDKIYTRIFTSSREKKGASCRPDRDIYSIFKQSHTTDMRHMLKITHKDSKEQRK